MLVNVYINNVFSFSQGPSDKLDISQLAIGKKIELPDGLYLIDRIFLFICFNFKEDAEIKELRSINLSLVKINNDPIKTA